MKRRANFEEVEVILKNRYSRHAKYIDTLYKIAESVIPVRQARIAACLVHQNSIISFGVNQMKSHPFQSKFSKNMDSIYLHAETDTIKNALKYVDLKTIEQSTLYICRVKYASSDKKKMIYGLAKPCLGCMKCLTNFSIKNVIYTEDGDSLNCL